jgi:SAM-dependent methyltransferase
MNTTTTHVAPSNLAQSDAWDGTEGSFWAAHAERFDRSMSGYANAFDAASGVQSDSRVLDIGCGTGQTTRNAARSAPHGHALGVDLSSQMINVARRLANREGLLNSEFRRADAQVHPFTAASFDLASSRTGTMFFGDPAAAFSNIARAVRPGGRLTMLTWQPVSRNEWFGAFVRALSGAPAPETGPAPFSMSQPDHVRDVLRAAGFDGVQIDSLEARMHFGVDADDAHQFVLGLLGWMLEGRSETERQRASNKLRSMLAEHEGPGGVEFASATLLTTAVRP